jgi:pimeloyl-ACP methyl ester carboxylesterase
MPPTEPSFHRVTRIAGREVSFEIDGLNYAGLEWGKPDAPLVLALHGWLDNALSFSVLAPLLRELRVVALDLSGQGYSDHRSQDATYHIWDDIPQLVGIVEQLGGGPVALLGHSRGAAIAVLLAAALGSRCSHLVLLDGLLPSPIVAASVPEQFARAQRDKRDPRKYRSRTFAGVEEFVAARRKLGFSEESARLLAPRALRLGSDADTMELTHDPRLNHASAIKLTQEMCSVLYGCVQARTLVLIAEEGLFIRAGGEVARRALDGVRDWQVEHIPGGHHTHMENGSPIMADHINRLFISAVDSSAAD